MTTDPSARVQILRPTSDADRGWLEAMWNSKWGGEVMVTRGTAHRLTDAVTFIARCGGEPVGAATFVGTTANSGIELLSLNAIVPRRGVGSALLAAVENHARADGFHRIWLITTNDNLDALRFYQRRGYVIAAVHSGAVDRARRLKPGIPEVGYYGIPIHDEVELHKGL